MRIVSAGLVVLVLLAGCDTEGDQESEAPPTSTSSTADQPFPTDDESPDPEGFFAAVEADSTDANMGYLEHLPPDYGTEPQPLLLTLHGWGGVASPMDAHLEFMSEKDWPEDLPFVVLAPLDQTGPSPGFIEQWCEDFDTTCVSQAQHDHAGPSGSNRCFAPSELHDFIEYAVAEYEVDPDRVYVSGESCGAYAVFDYLGVHGATQVAAAVPIAGDGRPAYNDVGCRLWAAPVWAFHSRKDPEVPLAGSEEPISASGECGGAAPRLTVVEGSEHLLGQGLWSGDLGYDVFGWLLKQRRP